MTNGMNQEAINQEASGTEAEGIGESVPEVGGAEATETVTEATIEQPAVWTFAVGTVRHPGCAS